MMKTKSTQSNPSASPRQIKEKPKGKNAVVSGIRRKKIPQQKYQKETLHKKAQAKKSEEIKYETAGESEEPGKHKTEEVCKRE